jgi:hypothetical protein
MTGMCIDRARIEGESDAVRNGTFAPLARVSLGHDIRDFLRRTEKESLATPARIARVPVASPNLLAPHSAGLLEAKTENSG